MSNKQETLSASYMKPFSCIGPDCEDSCCSGWQIGLSPKDLKRLREYLASQNRSKDYDDIVVFESVSSGGAADIARFNFSWDGACPMMEDGLCVMHRDQGERILPTLCSTFPRSFMETGSQIQLHGQFSCPEVVRLCLLGEPAYDLHQLEPERIPPRYEVTNVDRKNLYHKGLLLAMGYIRFVLSDQDTDLLTKNMALAAFCKRISSYCRRDIPRDPSPKIEKMIARLKEQPLNYTRPAENETPDVLLELVTGILGLRSQSCNNPRFRAMCAEVYGSYGQIGEILASGQPINSELRARLWHAYRTRRDKISELLGSHVERRLTRFCEAFWNQNLFLGGASPAISAHKLSFFMAVIRFMIFSHPALEQRFVEGIPLRDEEPVLDETLVAVVQIFVKYIGADDNLMKQIDAAMHQAGLDTTGNLAILLGF